MQSVRRFVPATGFLLCVIHLAWSPSLFAVDREWNINGDGLWTTAGNWDPAGVPGASDNAFIRNLTTSSSSVVVTITSGITQAVNNLTIDDTGIAAKHELFVSNNTFFDVFGGIVNNGVISLNSTGIATQMRLRSNITLAGTGQLVLGNGGPNSISASGGFTLTNASGHTMAGVGNIGANLASVINDGLIVANEPGGLLLLDPRNAGGGVDAFINNGTVRATNGGVIQLTGNGFGEFGGLGIFEAEAGSEVQIANSTILRNGTFTSAGTGLVRALDGTNTAFADVTNTGKFQVGNNADARMFGTITNTGEITLASTGNQSDFELGSDVILNGGGTLRMQGAVAQVNAVGGFTLTNMDNVIEGQGNLGGNTASIINDHLIHANVDGQILVVDPRNAGGGNNSFLNNGTVRASNGGIVQLTGSGFGEFGGAGTYDILNGSELQIADATILRDGTFSTTGTGRARTLDGSNTFFAEITNAGLFEIGNNADAQMFGTITNTGEIVLASTGGQSDFELGDHVTLTGGGTLTMTGPVAQINAVGGFVLTNSDNLIRGYGNLGGNTASVINDSLIHANISGEVLVIDPRNAGGGVNSFVNNDTVRASAGGIVQLTGNGFGEFGGSGTYEALDGSELQIANATILRESSFATAGTGLVRTLDGTNTVFIDITNNGVFQVGNNADAQMIGTITNSGNIVLASTGNQSDFELGGNVTLTGGGTLTLTGPVAQINAVGGFVLTNADNTIQGVGNIGANSGFYVNHGTIDAAVNAGTITIDPGNAGGGNPAFVNEMGGVMRVRNGASLQLTGNGFGELVNRDGGRIVVESTLQLVNSAIFRNETGGRVEGTGTINVVSGSFTNTGGVIAPGLSTGILNFDGTFNQVTGGTLEIEIAGPTPGVEHDQLAIVGTANLGGTLEALTVATIADPTARGDFDRFTVLTASVINGVFDDAIYDGNAMGAAGNLLYLGNNAQGTDGFFRGLRYTATEVNLVNYLALPGDANGDGVVDGSDFGIWNSNKFLNGTDWATGDFNGDGRTDGSDFGIWNANKFTSVAGGFRPVPEPSGLVLTSWLLLMALGRRR